MGPEVDRQVPRDPHLNQVEHCDVEGQAALAQHVDKGLGLAAVAAVLAAVVPAAIKLGPDHVAGEHEEVAEFSTWSMLTERK